MPLTLECPYCASCSNTFLGSFYSAVLTTKTTTYQCNQCLNLFDIPPSLLADDNNNKGRQLVTIYAYDCLMNRVAVDSYWADPNSFRLPNSTPTTLTTTRGLADTFNLVNFLLTLVFGVLSIMFGVGIVILGVS